MRLVGGRVVVVVFVVVVNIVKVLHHTRMHTMVICLVGHHLPICIVQCIAMQGVGPSCLFVGRY